MGCLNSEGQFDHWFSNIHFSGPCNRDCYFCIGQHMPGVNELNNLDTWPLTNLEVFIEECKRAGISEVNLTGANTDPTLYRHLQKLHDRLREEIPNLRLGLRTNGVRLNEDVWKLFDKASVSITSFDPDIYRQTMGGHRVPDIDEIVWMGEVYDIDLKANVILCPELLVDNDLYRTLTLLESKGIRRINVREPYGQPHIGNPLEAYGLPEHESVFGMPGYLLGTTKVTYWDVHYVEVESVNLYANGKVSLTYPVSLGHDPEVGQVLDQSHFSHPDDFVREAS